MPASRWPALSLATGLAAQTISQIRIGTVPSGVKFRVDGVEYQSTQTFLWPQGSKHTVVIFPVQTSTVPGQRLTFGGWTANGTSLGVDPEIVITADPTIKDITGSVTQEYLLKLIFASCPDPLTPCPSSNGKVSVNGGAYYGEADIWVAAASTVALMAQPLTGFVFSGWAGMPPGQERAPITNSSWIARGPSALLRRLFAHRAPHDSDYMQVLVDRAPVNTPADVDWAQGVRSCSAAFRRSATKLGNLWVFDSWDNGLPKGQNVTFTPAIGKNDQQVLTARFVPAASTTFSTEPAGLKLKLTARTFSTGNYSVVAPSIRISSSKRRSNRGIRRPHLHLCRLVQQRAAQQRLVVTRARHQSHGPLPPHAAPRRRFAAHRPNAPGRRPSVPHALHRRPRPRDAHPPQRAGLHRAHRRFAL